MPRKCGNADRPCGLTVLNREDIDRIQRMSRNNWSAEKIARIHNLNIWAVVDILGNHTDDD